MSVVNRPDARHLTIETQNYLRQQAIRLRQQGKRVKDISEYLGVHHLVHEKPTVK